MDRWMSIKHRRLIQHYPLSNNAASAHYKKYFGSLHKRARTIAKVYPGFMMRIYHNVSAEDGAGTAFLCKMVCVHAHVDLCDVTNLPTLG